MSARVGNKSTVTCMSVTVAGYEPLSSNGLVVWFRGRCLATGLHAIVRFPDRPARRLATTLRWINKQINNPEMIRQT
jgi:hypothetical protein